ncbi:MAG: LLM class flavin-dependent oxidoreductase [Xanthobacteraceae bacterium]
MKFGVALTSRLSLNDQISLAQACDTSGLSIWVPDERFFRDVFVTMSAVATATQHATIGSGVTDALIRHPLLTATAIASLNELSNGRAILGIGAGISGFDALGIHRQSPATAVRDAVGLCRRFWSGEEVTFEGKLFSARKAHLHFETTQSPIYIAGRGPKILTAGGELGDGVIIGHFTSEPGINFCMANIEEGIARRECTMSRPEIALWAYTSVSYDGNAARASVKPAIGRTLRSTPEVLKLFGVQADGLLEKINQFGYARSAAYDSAMQTIVPDELTSHLSISGTPAECVAQIQRLRKAGIDHIIALPYPAAGMEPGDMVALLQSDVLPHIRNA